MAKLGNDNRFYIVNDDHVVAYNFVQFVSACKAGAVTNLTSVYLIEEEAYADYERRGLIRLLTREMLERPIEQLQVIHSYLIPGYALPQGVKEGLTDAVGSERTQRSDPGPDAGAGADDQPQ